MLKEYIEKNRGLNNFNTSDVLDIIVNHIDEKNDDCDCCCVIGWIITNFIYLMIYLFMMLCFLSRGVRI